MDSNAEDFSDDDTALADQINEEGEEVFELEWDGGGPGSSGGYWVHAWRGKFAVSSADDCEPGPFGSLDEALKANDLLHVNSTVTSIRCTLLSDSKLAKKLICDDDEPFELWINEVQYAYRGQGVFRKIKSKK